MQERTRQILIFSLVFIFFAQTCFVYTDPAGRSMPPLSEKARQGQKIWLRKNCQSCHQIFGFGGFLGPDLTNAASRIGKERLKQILSVGSGQMPAFHLDAQQRENMHQFLLEINQTGIGQLRPEKNWNPLETMEQFLETSNALQKRGFSLMKSNSCLSCHLPNHQSIMKAPDLTTVLSLRSPNEIKYILENGIPEKGMPKFFHLEEKDIQALLAWLKILEKNHVHFLKSKSSPSSLPWFEYE
jgi:nitric oxide reductase subunit C